MNANDSSRVEEEPAQPVYAGHAARFAHVSQTASGPMPPAQMQMNQTSAFVAPPPPMGGYSAVGTLRRQLSLHHKRQAIPPAGTLRKLWDSAQQHLVLQPLSLHHLRHAPQTGLHAQPMVVGTVHHPRDLLILHHLHWEATLRVDMLLSWGIRISTIWLCI